MASANNYGYSNGGATTPPNAFVNNLLQTSNANVPFTATGAITNSLLPSSIVDDANAPNQLQFPHPGPHDYPWATPPAPTSIHSQHQHPQQHPHSHVHAHAQAQAQAQAGQQTDSNLMQNKSPRTYHRNHQQLINNRDHVQHSSALPTTSTVGVGSVVASQPISHHVHQQSGGVGAMGVGVSGVGGVAMHSGATYAFNTLPLTSAASASPALVPIAFDETALAPNARAPVSVTVPLGMGAPLAAPLAHPHASTGGASAARYAEQLVSPPAPPPAHPQPPAQPQAQPKKPPRARSRRRKSTQPPGTPCVPVHLRNPKKGRDRVFRKCQYCNSDNHIRRSNCEKCGKPLPAGKRRRDGSMHYEKLKRQKNAAAAAAAAAASVASNPNAPGAGAPPTDQGNINNPASNKSSSSPSQSLSQPAPPISAPMQPPPPIPAPLTQPINPISHLDKNTLAAAATANAPVSNALPLIPLSSAINPLQPATISVDVVSQGLPQGFPQGVPTNDVNHVAEVNEDPHQVSHPHAHAQLEPQQHLDSHNQQSTNPPSPQPQHLDVHPQH